jgi:hypothetical protein
MHHVIARDSWHFASVTAPLMSKYEVPRYVCKYLWLLMVTTKELGTYKPVDVLSIGDDVLGALVMTG